MRIILNILPKMERLGHPYNILFRKHQKHGLDLILKARKVGNILVLVTGFKTFYLLLYREPGSETCFSFQSPCHSSRSRLMTLTAIDNYPRILRLVTRAKTHNIDQYFLKKKIS